MFLWSMAPGAYGDSCVGGSEDSPMAGVKGGNPLGQRSGGGCRGISPRTHSVQYYTI